MVTFCEAALTSSYRVNLSWFDYSYYSVSLQRNTYLYLHQIQKNTVWTFKKFSSSALLFFKEQTNHLGINSTKYDVKLWVEKNMINVIILTTKLKLYTMFDENKNWYNFERVKKNYIVKCENIKNCFENNREQNAHSKSERITGPRHQKWRVRVYLHRLDLLSTAFLPAFTVSFPACCSFAWFCWWSLDNLPPFLLPFTTMFLDSPNHFIPADSLTQVHLVTLFR